MYAIPSCVMRYWMVVDSVVTFSVFPQNGPAENSLFAAGLVSVHCDQFCEAVFNSLVVVPVGFRHEYFKFNPNLGLGRSLETQKRNGSEQLVFHKWRILLVRE